MERILRDAVAQGLLAEADHDQSDQQRHWSVLLLTGVASWFSAIPLLGVVLLTLPSALKDWAGGLIVGGLLLAGSVTVLRSKRANLFVEQLGVPCLIAGGVLVGLGTYDLTRMPSLTTALQIVVACTVARLVPRAWLRTLLGAAIAGLAAFSVQELVDEHFMFGARLWLPSHVAAGTWLALQAIQARIGLEPDSAPLLALIEALSDGIAGAALVALAVFSGNTLLLGAIGGSLSPSGSLDAGAGAAYLLVNPLSSALAVLACAWLARSWPALRAWWFAALAALVAATAWFAPSLGMALLLLAGCAGSRRYALAALGGACALWMIGGLYYQLAWPLAHKAALLAGIGIAMCAIARFAVPAEIELPVSPVPQPEPVAEPKRRLGLVLCGVLVLAVANVGIWQKESVIKAGTAVFVELAPVDPRSLMQGDYMRLRFAIPGQPVFHERTDRLATAPDVIARVDARGVASLVRIDDGTPLAAGELRIQLVTKNGDWTIATDAWFFKEGEGARWANARYGEFRVERDGRALLVGLRGPALEKL
jgi:uncharacterized membrane-anchored protein